MSNYKYYAVHAGKETGVFPDWDSCKAQVNGFSRAVFKGFDDYQDAEYFVEFGPDIRLQIAQANQDNATREGEVVTIIDDKVYRPGCHE